MKKRLLNILIAVDQLANTFIGSEPDETFSAKCYRLKDSEKRRYAVMMKWLNILFNDPDHCKNAFISEQARKHLPTEYQK